MGSSPRILLFSTLPFPLSQVPSPIRRRQHPPWQIFWFPSVGNPILTTLFFLSLGSGTGLFAQDLLEKVSGQVKEDSFISNLSLAKLACSQSQGRGKSLASSGAASSSRAPGSSSYSSLLDYSRLSSSSGKRSSSPGRGGAGKHFNPLNSMRKSVPPVLCTSLHEVCIYIYTVYIYIKAPFHKSRINWIYDPAPPPPRSATLHSRNSHASIPSNRKNKMSAIATPGPPAVPLSPAPPKKYRIRRRQAQRAANRNSRIISAAPLTQDERWANQSAAGIAGATHTQPEDSDPTSTMRTAVYPPSRIVGGSLTNENSLFQIGLESSRIPGLL